MSPQTRTEIADLLESHGLSPVRNFGQHFLADPNITRKIVTTSGVGEGDSVVEVGAGTGALTLALAETGAKVVTYEVDSRLRPLLESVTAGMGVEARFADATKIDLAAELDGDRWVMVANLPYNVGTPLVLGALRTVPAIERFVVMIQREVARRFVAKAGDPAYGLPSVVVALYGRAKVAFTVPPSVFFPPPKVDSAVVLIDRKNPPPGSEAALALAQAGFGQRRKMLRRSLAAVLDDPEHSLEAAGIDPTLRAENLTADDYLRLAGVSG